MDSEFSMMCRKYRIDLSEDKSTIPIYLTLENWLTNRLGHHIHLAAKQLRQSLL